MILLLVAAAAAACLPGAALPLAEPGLEGPVRRALGQLQTEAGWTGGAPRCRDRVAVRTLNIGVLGDTRSLAMFANVEDLTIWTLEQADLTGLAGMKGLRRLTLDDMGPWPLSLAPLAGAALLEELVLPAGAGADLSPLAELRALRALSAHGGAIVDLGPLARATHLRSLDLGGNPLVEVGALAALHELVELDLSYTRVANVEALAGLRSLETLQLDGSAVEDLRPLVSLPKLKLLAACGTPVDRDPELGRRSGEVVEQLRARGVMVIVDGVCGY